MPKVFIVNGNHQYRKMFEDMGWEYLPIGGSVFDLIVNADLIQFTGGEDVTPSLYGEENTSSYNSEARDFYEAGIFAIARRMNKPMAGICRGGQFLNVMCGGKMIQDVKGHTKEHQIATALGKSVQVTSTHHQMMVKGVAGSLEAVANIVGDNDAEVIHYMNEKALCFQPHPEFHRGECQDYYFELLKVIFGLGEDNEG